MFKLFRRSPLQRIVKFLYNKKDEDFIKVNEESIETLEDWLPNIREYITFGHVGYLTKLGKKKIVFIIENIYSFPLPRIFRFFLREKIAYVTDLNSAGSVITITKKSLVKRLYKKARKIDKYLHLKAQEPLIEDLATNILEEDLLKTELILERIKKKLN